MATIKELRFYFDKMSLAQKKQFCKDLKKKVEASGDAELRRFLNECIQKCTVELKVGRSPVNVTADSESNASALGTMGSGQTKRKIVSRPVLFSAAAAVVGLAVGAMLLFLFLPSRQSMLGEPILLTVGSRSIGETEANFFLRSSASAMSSQLAFIDLGDEVGWASAAELVKNDALNSMRVHYAIHMKAGALDAMLTFAQQAGLDRIWDDRVNYFGGEEEFLEHLALYDGVNYELFRYLNETTVLRTNIWEALFGENGSMQVTYEQLKEYAEQQGYIRVTHVLRATRDENRERLSAEDVQGQRETAEEVLARAAAGEDFFSLLNEFGEDPGVMHPPHYHNFRRGTMVDEFEFVAFSLLDYEVSGIVETSFGFHIIKRLPINPEIVRISHANHEVNSLMAELGNGVMYVLSEEWENIDIRDLNINVLR